MTVCLGLQENGGGGDKEDWAERYLKAERKSIQSALDKMEGGMPSSMSQDWELRDKAAVGICGVHISVLTDGVNSPNRAEMRVENQVSVNPCFKVSLAQCLQVMLKGSFVGKFEIAGDHRAENCTANGPDRTPKVAASAWRGGSSGFLAASLDHERSLISLSDNEMNISQLNVSPYDSKGEDLRERNRQKHGVNVETRFPDDNSSDTWLAD
ncbi:hypothetical protein U0070_018966 [Myodes glareolus]|uniref:Uncharacterized protein n=1 Tax=Myodes glareolus TaxID=447135 RepID=A0AAW0IU83_MYOGA